MSYLQKESDLCINDQSFLEDKIQLTETKYIVGRKPSPKYEDVALIVNDKRISGEHFSIENRDGTFMLTDLR